MQSQKLRAKTCNLILRQKKRSSTMLAQPASHRRTSQHGKIKTNMRNIKCQLAGKQATHGAIKQTDKHANNTNKNRKPNKNNTPKTLRKTHRRTRTNKHTKQHHTIPTTTNNQTPQPYNCRKIRFKQLCTKENAYLTMHPQPLNLHRWTRTLFSAHFCLFLT